MCTKFIYDHLKKEKAKRSLTRPKPEHSCGPDIKRVDLSDLIDHDAPEISKPSMKLIESEGFTIVEPKKLKALMPIDDRKAAPEPKKVVTLSLDRATPWPKAKQGQKENSKQIQRASITNVAPHMSFVFPTFSPSIWSAGMMSFYCPGVMSFNKDDATYNHSWDVNKVDATYNNNRDVSVY